MTTMIANSVESSEDASAGSSMTKDYLLGGRVLVQQPTTGYRVAIDPIFLAASIQVEPGETVLDVGAGVGAASLCLATRLPDIRILGVELQREYVRLAYDNIKLNNLNHRIEILNGDLLRPPPRLAAGTFAHVMTNPPFFEVAAARLSPNPGKAKANIEGDANLEQWVKFCLLMVKPKGVVTFIYTVDRLDELLVQLYGKLGGITIYPLWPAENREAKRVLVQGIKGGNAPTRMMPGIVLHGSDGKYTNEAENILRHAQALHINE